MNDRSVELPQDDAFIHILAALEAGMSWFLASKNRAAVQTLHGTDGHIVRSAVTFSARGPFKPWLSVNETRWPSRRSSNRDLLDGRSMEEDVLAAPVEVDVPEALARYPLNDTVSHSTPP